MHGSGIVIRVKSTVLDTDPEAKGKTMATNDGGQAFPRAKREWDGVLGQWMMSVSPGMTLRDYIAIHAPTEDLALPDSVEEAAASLGIETKDYDYKVHWFEVVSKARFLFAGAMLFERDHE